MSEVLLKIEGCRFMWTRMNICRGRENLRLMGMAHRVVMVPKGRTRWIGWPTRGTLGTGGASAPTTSKVSGYPILQGGTNPWPGYHVSTTAYIHSKYYYADPRRYLDSENVLFAVIPGNVRKAVAGICKGCKARVTDKRSGKAVDCVIGDIGPSDHMGEGSIKLAGEFGLDISPKYGGSADESRFLWECWPGVAAAGYVLQG